jgi:hypothetical protein
MSASARRAPLMLKFFIEMSVDCGIDDCAQMHGAGAKVAELDQILHINP